LFHSFLIHDVWFHIYLAKKGARPACHIRNDLFPAILRPAAARRKMMGPDGRDGESDSLGWTGMMRDGCRTSPRKEGPRPGTARLRRSRRTSLPQADRNPTRPHTVGSHLADRNPARPPRGGANHPGRNPARPPRGGANHPGRNPAHLPRGGTPGRNPARPPRGGANHPGRNLARPRRAGMPRAGPIWSRPPTATDMSERPPGETRR
jgi:hypothetical protein